MSEIQLKGSLTIGAVDVSAFVHTMTIHRTRNNVTVPPTLANIREVTKAGALVESLEINFHSSMAAAGLWAELYDAIDTDTAELTFSGCLFEDAAVSADNPEFSGSFVVMSIDTMGEVGALRRQSQTYPITGAGITKDTGVSEPMGDLAELRHDLSGMLADLEPVQHSVGMFGKVTALDAAERDLGSDRQMSGKPVTLGAGYDTGNPVVLHLRPAGLWVLADQGRRRSGPIKPKRRRAAKNPPHPKAVNTPHGWRGHASYGRSRGLNTIRDVEAEFDRGVERAVLDGLDDVLRKGGWI